MRHHFQRWFLALAVGAVACNAHAAPIHILKNAQPFPPFSTCQLYDPAWSFPPLAADLTQTNADNFDNPAPLSSPAIRQLAMVSNWKPIQDAWTKVAALVQSSLSAVTPVLDRYLDSIAYLDPTNATNNILSNDSAEDDLAEDYYLAAEAIDNFADETFDGANPIADYDYQAAEFDHQIAGDDYQATEYDDQVAGYDDPLVGYDDQVAQLDEPMVEYDRQANEYDDQANLDAIDATWLNDYAAAEHSDDGQLATTEFDYPYSWSLSFSSTADDSDAESSFNSDNTSLFNSFEQDSWEQDPTDSLSTVDDASFADSIYDRSGGRGRWLEEYQPYDLVPNFFRTHSAVDVNPCNPVTATQMDEPAFDAMNLAWLEDVRWLLRGQALRMLRSQLHWWPAQVAANNVVQQAGHAVAVASHRWQRWLQSISTQWIVIADNRTSAEIESDLDFDPNDWNQSAPSELTPVVSHVQPDGQRLLVPMTTPYALINTTSDASEKDFLQSNETWNLQASAAHQLRSFGRWMLNVADRLDAQTDIISSEPSRQAEIETGSDTVR